MKLRFSVVAFVPPNAQLGVVGSAPFLGEWDVKKCLPLLPYSTPHPAGQEPSLWFRDVDIPSVSDQNADAAAVDRAAVYAGGAARGAAAAGDVAGSEVLNREESEDPACYVVNGGRGGGDASSGCSQCLNRSNNSVGCRSSCGNTWLDRTCCCCSTRVNNDSGCRVNNRSSDRYFIGGGCPRCPDSTCCTTSSSRRTAGNSGGACDSSRGAGPTGLDSGCEGPPATAAVCDVAEESSFSPRCAVHPRAASVSHAGGFPDTATVAAASAYGPVFCPTCREEDVNRDTDFAWRLLLAASHAQPSGRRAAVTAAGEGSSISRTCCCSYIEHVNGRHTHPTAGMGCRDHWDHNGIHPREQQLQRLQGMQDEADLKCEPKAVYYSAASSEHQERQSEAMQAPLRRCCRRRDQALSSVEGRGYSGAAAAACEGPRRGFIDGAAAAGQPTSGGFLGAAPTVEPSRCAHDYFHREQHDRCGETTAVGEPQMCKSNSVWDAAAYSIDPRIPAVLQLLESHPLKLLRFEYKFILWYPPSEKAAMPCFPTGGGREGAGTDPAEAYVYGSSACASPVGEQAGNGMQVRAAAGRAEEKPTERYSRISEEGRGGWSPRTMQRGRKPDFCCLHRRQCSSNRENWREWLFPPFPARLPSPPEAKEMLVWEGTGAAQNRRFVFDPFDVVVDLNRRGELQCLYICKVAHFRDPRAGGTGEYELTTRFYNSVRSESGIHFSKICPGLYVGSCPRQLLHLRLLKEELKVTCIFNMQTEQDICNNYPDPMATARSAQDVSHLCDSQGLRYVWLPTTDMCDSARKAACANAAFLLLGLIKSGHCVYVHCNAGVGRSVAAVSAFLCFAVGLDLRKVNFLICAKRPVAYWDEKAMKYGLGDYTYKYGKCTVLGDTFKEKNEENSFCCT